MAAFLIVAGLAAIGVGIVRLLGRFRWIPTRRIAALVMAGGLVLFIAGGAVAGSTSTPSPSTASSPASSPSSAPPRASSAPPPASTAPPSSRPAPASPSATRSGSLQWQGQVALPDHALTPGAVFAGVTASQVCTPGWAAAHRDVTDSERYAVFAEYGIPYAQHDNYEVDHLIPLELGGSNDIGNLWPEPQAGTAGYPSKDRLENHLHDLVCAGSLGLRSAQQQIAANWWRAYLRYETVPAPEPSSAPAEPTPAATVHPGAFCSVAGQAGQTSAGTPMVCKTTPTDPRLRWRSAG